MVHWGHVSTYVRQGVGKGKRENPVAKMGAFEGENWLMKELGNVPLLVDVHEPLCLRLVRLGKC